MDTITSIEEYLKSRQKAEPPKPVWIRRMNEGKLPNKDLTEYRNGQQVPSGSDGAA